MAHTRLTCELRTAAPFDERALRDFLTVHAIPGRDHIDTGGHTEHAIDVPGGLAVATIDWPNIASDGASHVVIPVTFELPEPSDAACAAQVVRRMLDLDSDPAAIADALSVSARLRPLIAARPGLRLPGARDAAEFALGTVLGQQVSLAAARTLQGRLADRFGRSTPGVRGFRAAPDVARVAATPAPELREQLGLTNARAATLRTLAVALAGDMCLDAAADQTRTRSQLLDLKGIGPWTVEIIALRVLGDSDAFPAGDLILRRTLGVVRDKAAQLLAEPWRPYRGYATQHLWAEYVEGAAAKSQ